jgi:hypothetical protein
MPSSTPRLSDVARHVVSPKGAVTTGWDEVEAECADLGISFRWWQKPIGRLILAKRADGKYAATIGGTGLSIPRQVGKTFLLGAIVFALCLLRPNLTVIWTAHRLRTAEETFGKMQAFAKRAGIKPHVRKVVLGSGEEAILFRNDSRILFGARESGFGLGFDEVDVLIFDEAQRLKESTLDDMIPATNQSRQETGALLIFAGTPPRPTDNGEVFTRMRSEALSGEDDDTGWVEMGADTHYGPPPLPAPLTKSDWAQVAKANPSFPDDTPREAILRMRKKLGPDSFLREGLGIWDEDAGNQSVIDMEDWARLRDRDVPQPKSALLAVDVAPDRKWSSIGVASEVDGRTLVMTRTKAGTAWVVPALVALRSERRISEISLNMNGQAAVLVPALTEALVPFVEVNQKELGKACAAFQEAVTERRLVHVGQAELDAAVRNARTRYIGEAEHWDRRDREVDISALVACSLAAHRASVKAPSVYEQRGIEVLG